MFSLTGAIAVLVSRIYRMKCCVGPDVSEKQPSKAPNFFLFNEKDKKKMSHLNY